MGLSTLSRRLFRIVRPLKTTRQRRSVRLSVRTLESRIVLNGDAGVAAGQLVLDGFGGAGANPGVQITETTHDFADGKGVVAAYEFTLVDLGKWSDQGTKDFNGDGKNDYDGVNSDLFISKDWLDNVSTGLLIDDTKGNDPTVEFGTGAAPGVNFSNVDLVTLKGVDDITQNGGLQTDDLTFTTVGNITLTNAANDFQGTVTIATAGAASFVDSTAITLGTVSGVQTLSVTGTTINLTGDITTAGNQTFTGPVVLQNDIVDKLTTNDAGTIKFNNDITSPTAKSLTLTSVGSISAGKIDLSGGGLRGDLTVSFDSDNDSTVTSTIGAITAQGVTIKGGTTPNDTFTLTGDIDATGAVAISQVKSFNLANSITTNGKDVSISAGTDVTIAATGKITTANGNVTITADSDSNDVGKFTMADGSTINSALGKIAISAGQDVTITGLTTTNITATAVTITSTAGSVLDGGDTNTDITAASGRVVINADGNIGDLNGVNAFTGAIAGTKAIETKAAELDLTSGGNIVIDQTGNTALIQVNAKAGGAGTAFIHSTGNIDASAVTGIGATDKVTLISDATLTLPAAGLAATDLRLEGADLAGGLKIDADRVIVRSNAAETVQIVRDDSQVDAFAGGGLTLNADKSMELVDFTGDGIAATANLNNNVTVTAGVAALGSLTVTGKVVATGTGTIGLTAQNGGDVVINADVSSAAGKITIAADRDIIVGAKISTTTAATDISLTADNDANGTGGVWIQTAGQVNSAGAVAITGSDLNAAPPSSAGLSTVDSIVVDADGGNDQVLAVGNITLASSAAAAAGADVILLGAIHSTGDNTGVPATSTFGNITITAKDQTFAGSSIKADLGNVTFNSPVRLAADLTVTATGAALDAAKAGNVIFASTINDDGNGATTSNLTVNADSVTTFAGKVGTTAAITSLTTDAPGSTQLNGGAVTTVNAQTYNDTVTLGADTTLTSTGNKAITFAKTLDDDGNAGTTSNLTVTTGGAAIFTGKVGTVPIDSLLVNGGGSAQINGGLVTTVGAQTYTNNVTLGADTTLTSNTNQNITFNGKLDDDGNAGTTSNLLVNTTGDTVFGAAVGATAALTSLTTNVGGFTRINGSGVRTTGAQTYNDAVTIGADTTLASTGGADITFVSTLDDDGNAGTTSNVVINTTGNTVFSKAVGATSPLDSLTTDAGGKIDLNGGSVTTVGAQSYGDAVILTADTTLTSTGNKAITFSSTVDDDGNAGTGSKLTVTTGGATTFGDKVGQVAIDQLLVNGGGTAKINGGLVQTIGTQQYDDNVTLGADTTLISTGNQNITFNGKLDDDGNAGTTSNLTVNTTGLTTFNGAVGTTAITSLTTNAGGTTQINGGQIRTTAAQTYNDAVTIGADATLSSTGAGDITFNNTLDDDGNAGTTSNVTINTAGNTVFTKAVGTVALTSLTTDNGGTTDLNGGSVTTTGKQTYGDAVILSADTILTSTGNANITFGSTVDDDGNAGTTSNLTVNTAGLTTFNGAVGTTAITSLTTNAGGTTQLNGGLVQATGKQTYGDAVTLGSNNTLTSTGNQDITFNSTVDDDGNGGTNSNLTVNTAGLTIFQGAVGTTAITSLTTNAGGTTQVNGGLVRTTAAQTFNDAVTVGADTAFTSTGNQNIRFATTLDDDGNAGTTSNVTVTTGGTAIFDGKVGQVPLTSLLVNGGGSAQINGGSVVTTGTQTYSNNVTLGADTTLTSNGNQNITFNGTLNDDGNAGTTSNLTVNTTGVTAFNGVVGTAALTSLTTNAGGTTQINGGQVRTTGAQTFNDAVTVGADALLASTAAGNITFNSTLDDDGNAGTTSNVVINTTGNTVFAKAVGTTPLTSLTTDAGGTTQVNGGLVQTTGAQTFGDAVTVGADTLFASTAAGDIAFNGTLDDDGNAGTTSNVTVNTTGNTIFSKAVGTTPLTSLTTNAGGTTQINGGLVQTTAAQTYGDAVTIGADAALTSTGAGNITFNSTLDDDGNAGTTSNLTINTTGNTVFAKVVGTTPLTSLTTNAGGATQINGGKVQTTAAQTYNDAVTIGADTLLASATAGNITFNSTLNDDGNAGTTSNVTINTSGNTVFAKAVGTAPLTSLTTDAGGTTQVNGGLVQTIAAQTYGDAVTIGADANFTSTAAGNVTFNGTLDDDGNAGTTSNVAVNTTGTTAFNKAVGTVALTSLATNAGGTTQINGGQIQTSGFQSYGDAVIVGDGTQALTAGGNLTFLSTIDGVAHGKGDLVTQSQALTRFAAPIGKTNAIHSLISTSKDMTFDNNVYVTVTNGTAATAGSKDADLGVHLTVNGALVLGSGFYVQAAESAPGVYDAVGTTFTTKTGSGNPEFQSNFDFGTDRFLTEITVTPGAPAQAGKGPNGTLLPAEKGLRVYVDWGDTVLNQDERYEGPADEYGAAGFKGFDPNKSGAPNQLSGLNGGETITLEHGYSRDDVDNQLKVDPTFDVRYTVSQHPSIVIQAETLTQNGVTSGTAGQLTTFSTTFQSPTQPGVTTAPLPTAPPPPPPFNPVLTDGRAEVRVSQVPFLKPLEPTPLPKPRVYAVPNAPPPAPIVLANVVIQEQTVPTSTVVGREQKFVLKLLSPDPNLDPIASTELPDDAFQTERLQRLFQELPDGAYEIDLVLGEGNERPILRFDIRQGKPVVPDETLEGGQLRLEEVQDAVRRVDLENTNQFVPSPEATQPVPPAQNSNQDREPTAPAGESMGMIDSGREAETTEESSDRADGSSAAAIQPTAPGHRDVEWRWQVRKQLETNENPYRLASRLARRVRS